MLTDTNGFANCNVDKNTFIMAAELLDTGIDFHNIYYTILSKCNKAQHLLRKIVIDRLEFFNDGKIAFDDTPKHVFMHYKELEKIGLAAPQITYIMRALYEKGLDVDLTATTVEEAKRSILMALSARNSLEEK